MKFRIYSFRYGLEITQGNNEMKIDWDEVSEAINDISEEDLIESFRKEKRSTKSLSITINNLIRDRLLSMSWNAESPIFHDSAYTRDRRWRLDFAKGQIAIEVAFNHREAIAWNLVKPVLSSELNHVNKAIQTSVGIVVTATENLKVIGGFDGAVGTYETHLTYLKPMRSILTVPMIILGLEAPESFMIKQEVIRGRKIGKVVPILASANTNGLLT